MNGRVYFSYIEPEWAGEAERLTYWVCPRRWWSIKDWKLALDFRKNMNLGFIQKS
jgi:hypothetical protein